MRGDVKHDVRWGAGGRHGGRWLEQAAACVGGWHCGDSPYGLLPERFGTDMRGHDLDGPLSDLGESDSYHGFARVMLSKAWREAMTLRDLYNLVAAARGHWVLCGSAEHIADTFEEWFVGGAADGFNVMPPYFPGGLTDFVELVVPILQARGLFRREYAGTTLRGHLGLVRAARGR